MSSTSESMANGQAPELSKEAEYSVPRNTQHPLDPLTATEINTACVAAKEYAAQKMQLGEIKFAYISLIEPPKEDVLRFVGLLVSPGSNSYSPKTPERECEIAIIDVNSGAEYLLQVNLNEEPLFTKELIKLPIGTHFCVSPEEIDEAEEIVKSDIHVQKLCKEVGISKEQIACDGWAIGFDSRFENHKRLQQCFMYARLVKDGNLYAHPLDFVVIVDTLAKKVIHIDFPPHRIVESKLSSGTTQPPPLRELNQPLDTEKVQKSLMDSGRKRILPPMQAFQYLPDLLYQKPSGKVNPKFAMRNDLKPLYIVQPEGVSFALDGNNLVWQKWNMHVGFNYREGLIINTVTYEDKGVVRPLFYRLSLAEMVVPYAAPETPHNRKFAFDVGEYGLGNLANSLVLGCDCVGEIKYLDVVNVSLEGKAKTIKNAICIHEEDAGILWKHSDLRPGGRVHSVRSRKLVVSMICTIANYEYLFYWNFFQDGTISFEIKLSGILNLYLLAEGEKTNGFGIEVAPRIIAQHHAHTFCLRIHPMIDGLKNSVVQTDLLPLAHATGTTENYLGNGFQVHHRVLKETNEGAQKYDHSKGRYWTIINPNKLHYASKDPIGYRIVCRDQPRMLAKPDSLVAQRAPFAKHDFFVTPYVPHQYYPAGKFVPGTTETPQDSIENWLTPNKNIENEDIVVYLTYGINHVASPEQFPIMSAEVLTVVLKPSSFFDQNTSLDVQADIKPRKPECTHNSLNDNSGC
ncbi:hypothetical protein O181_039147 [Austropuccinia psidii MF-1]|uniref:Amine oxidase n=1 Tax=Austropuccinia psidii MF-1 TaxID=1389203 RepID=A0A9Q3DCB0_9BASI|nr:hypothetical protein [Austropuccinia psidii MF-1]